jgi:hypothetical protein
MTAEDQEKPQGIGWCSQDLAGSVNGYRNQTDVNDLPVNWLERIS